MKYIQIPCADGSDMTVSRIAIGSTMSMERLPDDEKFRLYDVYQSLGGNCIDTARAYHDGEAERMVGDYFRSRKNRSRFLVSTKGGHPRSDAPQLSRVHRKDILEDLETSLLTLGTDYIDIYWIHKDDPQTEIEELVDTANEIIRQGKARCVGLSNFDLPRFDAASRYAKASGQTDFAAAQIQWSLAETEDRFFRMFGSLVMTPARYAYFRERKMPVFAFSSQAQGFFARVAENGLDSLPPFVAEQFGSADNLKRLEKVKAFANEHHCSIAAPCLAYLIDNRLPCTAIIGASREEMLRQSMEAADLDMSPEQADDLFRV